MEREMAPCFPGEPGSDDPLASEATSSQLMQKSGPMQCPSEFPQGHTVHSPNGLDPRRSGLP